MFAGIFGDNGFEKSSVLKFPDRAIGGKKNLFSMACAHQNRKKNRKLPQLLFAT